MLWDLLLVKRASDLSLVNLAMQLRAEVASYVSFEDFRLFFFPIIRELIGKSRRQTLYISRRLHGTKKIIEFAQERQLEVEPGIFEANKGSYFGTKLHRYNRITGKSNQAQQGTFGGLREIHTLAAALQRSPDTKKQIYEQYYCTPRYCYS